MPSPLWRAIANIISVDVEDYFHPNEVQQSRGVRPDQWDSLPSRVEAATKRTLDLFARHQTQGTFFILGWVARKFPRLVRDIADAGHEIACHSHLHRLVYDLTPAEFRDDTRTAVDAISQACGIAPKAYRAPSYTITSRSMWALEILAECGFTHDSSIYPIHHDRYGIPGYSRRPVTVSTPSGPIVEVPIAAVELARGHVAPVGGGGYLRLLPYAYTAAGIRRLNMEERVPACIYFHPWEIDPHQPKLATGALARLRTYLGLAGMESKIDRLMTDFRFSTMAQVHPAPHPAE